MRLKKIKRNHPKLVVVVISAARFRSALELYKFAEPDAGLYTEAEKMEETGETQKFPVEARQPDTVANAVFESMIDLNGANLSTEKQEITLRFSNPKEIRYQTFDMLPERLKEVIRKSVGCYGQQIQVLVQTRLAGQETKLLFQPKAVADWERKKSGTQFETVDVTTITTQSEGESGVTVTKQKMEDAPGLRIHKALAPRECAAPAPLECEIVGMYHPDPTVLQKLELWGSKERLVYSLVSDVDIPAGLELYYKHIGEAKRTAQPNEVERRMPLSMEGAKTLPGWGDIFSAIQQYAPPLSDKQKIDILSAAWAFTFTYDDSLEINEQYAGLEGEHYYKELISQARGNCSHASEGFTVLCRTAGIPSADYSGYLGNNGRFFPGTQSHGQTDVFINGEWVLVEPQNGIYVSNRYQQEKLPGNFAKLIRKLPEGTAKPSRIAYDDPLQNLGLSEVLEQIMRQGSAGEEIFLMLEETERLLRQDTELYKGGGSSSSSSRSETASRCPRDSASIT